MIDQIGPAIEEARNTGGWHEVQRYVAAPEEKTNEVLVFLKPELTTKLPSDPRAFDTCLDSLSDFDCEIVASHVLGSRYLQRHRLIEQHYGLINLYSTGGFDALPQAGQVEAVRVLGLATADEAATRVLGAHQLLVLDPAVTAADLLRKHDQAAETYRLATGAYAYQDERDGVKILVIDGFHPSQIEHFYSTTDPIVVFVVRSSRSWQSLREDMCGATNPAKARMGSIRRTLLDQSSDLGLAQFDAMRNGIHVSAGPLEAAVEIARYLSNNDAGATIEVADTSFGQQLSSELGASVIQDLAANKGSLRSGRSPFDATELVDAADAISLLIDETSQ